MPSSRRPSTIRGLALLVFRPAEFVEQATALALQSEPPASTTEDRRNKLRVQNRESTDLIRASLAKSVCISAVTILAGLATGAILRASVGAREFRLWTIVLQSAGAALILAATLALLDWSIRTWNGRTLPEGVNRFAYRLLYVLGTYVIVASLLL